MLYLLVPIRCCAQTHFEEYQLAHSLHSLSPLCSPHPRVMQHSPVRASTPFYRHFTLEEHSSLRFGSTLPVLFGPFAPLAFTPVFSTPYRAMSLASPLYRRYRLASPSAYRVLLLPRAVPSFSVLSSISDALLVPLVGGPTIFHEPCFLSRTLRCALSLFVRHYSGSLC